MNTSPTSNAGQTELKTDSTKAEKEQDKELREIREHLKKKLKPTRAPGRKPELKLVGDKTRETRQYWALSGIMTESIVALIERICRRKKTLPHWIGALLIGGITFLVGMIISWARRENLELIQVQFSAWYAVIGALLLIINKVMINIFLNTFRGSPVEKMSSIKELADLENWLDKAFNYKWPLFISLTVGSGLGVFLFTQWNQVQPGFQEKLLIGPLFITILSTIQAMIAIYYIFPFYLLLPGRLSKYQFDLFKANPSSSEVAKRLSDMFTLIMYLTIGFIILVMISYAYFGLLNINTILFLGIGVWLPTIALYVLCQYNLSKIITNSKWGMLNDIQEKIQKLSTKTETPSRETLEHIENLLNYHDRIHNTPNSVLKFTAMLNFLNSILLPLITLVIANWSTIKELISRF